MAPPLDDFGGALPRISVRPPGPASRALAHRLRGVESRNVTWLGQDFPVFWQEAGGANVLDADGNVYLDLTGAFGVAAVGHANPRVVEAVGEQSRRLLHGMGDVHPPEVKVRLLEALAERSPWPDARVVLGTSGSEAVEVALKTAQLATGRSGVVAFEGGYHGLTTGALAVTHRDYFKEPFARRLYQGVAFAPFPDTEGNTVAESLESVASLLESGAPNGDPVGAVIVEPIQGRAGVRIPPPGFLPGLAELARDAGALLVADEVFTGFGRTGRMFAWEHDDVAPDVLCVGKALGGGVPVGACMASRDVMDAWPESRGEALHTSTFLGHPLACAAALAVLEELDERALVQRSLRLGERMVAGMKERLTPAADTFHVRGRGLFIAVEPRSRDGAIRPGAGVEVATAALGHGLLLLPAGHRGQVVELAPPLTITEEQADFAVEVLARILTARGP